MKATIINDAVDAILDDYEKKRELTVHNAMIILMSAKINEGET